MEDLHWADASTLELLHLLVDQVPTARVLALLTFRPEFTPPWGARSHVAHVTLTRLPQQQTETMIARLTQGKALPAEVHRQLVLKTDGVPLFVEELTRMVLESGLLSEREERYELTGPLPPLAIPTTLHDSLMARVDKLATVKEVLLSRLLHTQGKAAEARTLLSEIYGWFTEGFATADLQEARTLLETLT
jgi:predicted ATPase